MSKKTSIILLILENIILVILTISYLNYKDYKNLIRTNIGIQESCSRLALSEDLTSVLQKMHSYNPTIRSENEKVYLNYGITKSESAGVALLFENYKLVSKFCNSKWEPAVDAIRVNE